MFGIISSFLEKFKHIVVSKEEVSELNAIIIKQEKLESLKDLTSEEELAIIILQNENEKKLISYLNKILKDQNYGSIKEDNQLFEKNIPNDEC